LDYNHNKDYNKNTNVRDVHQTLKNESPNNLIKELNKSKQYDFKPFNPSFNKA